MWCILFSNSDVMASIALGKRLLKKYGLWDNFLYYSTTAPKIKTNKNTLLISCKQKKLDYYLGSTYNKLDEVSLASKGWLHSKSKGDYFTIIPISKQEDEGEGCLFSNLGINKLIIDALKNIKIKEATSFQTKAITTVQRGVHTLLAAETGCGKTIAFLLPIIQNIINSERNEQLNAPKAVVLVPNRELAFQTTEFANILGAPFGIKVKTVTGGRTKYNMMNPQLNDVDIIVATPGALSKLSTVGIYKLNQVLYFVLDEADTLLDDGFIDRVEVLIKRMSQAQLILVSATLPRKLPDILAPYESRMEQVVSPNLHMPLLHVKQKFMRITKSDRPARLLQLTKFNKEPMIIFTNKHQNCNWLAMFLRENGISCANINGDMNYAIRIEQWNKFIRGETNILSATDVGSRGLNTIQVKHILNYDFPIYAADYLHRIGRVGRLGSPHDSKITNFICSEPEVNLVQQIELAIRRNVPLTNVDGNITKIVHNNILRKIRQGP